MTARHDSPASCRRSRRRNGTAARGCTRKDARWKGRQIGTLRRGVVLKDGACGPAQVEVLAGKPPGLWRRDPPIRFRKNTPTRWVRIGIREGRNRQVRRMTAKVGLPTLRLIREAIGPYSLAGLAPGELRPLDPDLLADARAGQNQMN